MRQDWAARTQEFRDACRSKRQRLKEAIQDMLSHTGLNTARHIWNLRATQLGGQSARLASIPADVGVWA